MRENVKSTEIMSVYDIQQESNEWRQKAYPDTSGALFQLAGVTEEVGELAHAVLKYKQGIRGYDQIKMRDEAGDAIGDTIIYLCGLASDLGLSVEHELNKAWQHVKKRNITQGSDPGTCTLLIRNSLGKEGKCNAKLNADGTCPEPTKHLSLQEVLDFTQSKEFLTPQNYGLCQKRVRQGDRHVMCIMVDTPDHVHHWVPVTDDADPEEKTA